MKHIQITSTTYYNIRQGVTETCPVLPYITIQDRPKAHANVCLPEGISNSNRETDLGWATVLRGSDTLDSLCSTDSLQGWMNGCQGKVPTLDYCFTVSVVCRTVWMAGELQIYWAFCPSGQGRSYWPSSVKSY